VIPRDVHDDAKDSLRLRLAPHRMDNTPDILADCPPEHPFFVKDKGNNAFELERIWIRRR
jgi:hypothetical protein